MNSLLIPVLSVLFAIVIVWVYRTKRRTSTMSQNELMARTKSETNTFVLDVRSPREYSSGHIPGAMNISHTELSNHLEKLRQYEDKDVVVYCERGVRAQKAQGILRAVGFSHVYHLKGDMGRWRIRDLPTETGGNIKKTGYKPQSNPHD
ncbi:MAG: rhodanese-like domain-containing protein [Candidatus Scalinduaceae bacterium]